MTKKNEIRIIEEEYKVCDFKIKKGRKRTEKKNEITQGVRKEVLKSHHQDTNLKSVSFIIREKSKIYDRSLRLLGLVGVVKLISFRPFNRRVFSFLRPHLYKLSFKEVDQFYDSFRFGLPRKFYYDDSYAISFIRSYNLRKLGK